MKTPLLLTMVLFFTACTKYDKPGHVKKPGIVLSFDDNSIDNWYSHLEMFDSFGVRATFYVSNYNKLSSTQIVKLHEIQNRGHEIAYHTTNHPDLTKYLQKYGMQTLLKNEIINGLRQMNADGFYPTTFAYPYGSTLPQIDVQLWKYFKSLRLINSSKNYAQSCTPTTDNAALFALDVEERGKKSIEFFERMMATTKQHNNCLLLYAHQIGSKNNIFSVSESRLRKLFKYAQQEDLAFYTTAEVSLK